MSVCERVVFVTNNTIKNANRVSYSQVFVCLSGFKITHHIFNTSDYDAQWPAGQLVY